VLNSWSIRNAIWIASAVSAWREIKKVAMVRAPTMMSSKAKIDLLFVKKIEKIIERAAIKKWAPRL
jgi:hypothetical protein